MAVLAVACGTGVSAIVRKIRGSRTYATAPSGGSGRSGASTESTTPVPETLVGTADQFARVPELRHVRVVIGEDSGTEAARGGAVEVTWDLKPRLYVLLQCATPGDVTTNTYYSDAPAAMWGTTPIPSARLHRWPEDQYGPLNIRWRKIEPKESAYANRTAGGTRWDPIHYEENPVHGWDNNWSVPADVGPTHQASALGDYGTMRYAASVFLGRPDVKAVKVLSSTGLEAAHSQWGIAPTVPRLSVRRDDTFAGWVFAWGNVPYVANPASPTGVDRDHQAEQFLGADDASLCIAAARRMGLTTCPYVTSARGLLSYAHTVVTDASASSNGTMLAGGERVVWGLKGVQAGDMVLYEDHVAVLVEDAGRAGVLDVDDVVIHQSGGPPALSTVGQAGPPRRVAILRWPMPR